jgi:hypothetical protein
MAYLLLLGFLCSVAFVYSAPGYGSARAAARFGFGLLALGLLAQLVLGFDLNTDFARLFYFARYMLASVWLGVAALLFWPRTPKAARFSLVRALAAASTASLLLIAATQITQAQDWYQPAAPVYSQIHELLATNRPTRWGAAALSAAGLLALLAVAADLVRRGRLWPAVSLAAGALALAAPLLWPPRVPSLAFHAVELAGPLLLYFGLNALADFEPGSRR